MEIGMRAGQLTLMSVLPNTPAARAGLKSGDQILAIGTRRTAGLTFTAALKLLQGPEDSWLELSVLPLSSPRSRTLRLRRERLKLEPVTARMLTNQVAYVRIQSLFPDQVPEALQQALTGLEQAGMTALILDLRDNPGGTLHNAIETGSVFLAQGPIVRVRDRQDQETLHEATGLPLVDSGVELVVLVNGGTASAAEIVAASLQEHGRARLVGRTTFGKGRVQRVLSLSNGAGLSLTTSTYLTAHGHDLQGRGIVPDFEVADDLREGDPVLAFARHLLAPLPQ
jgi:carboxyl-terminal processing protease